MLDFNRPENAQKMKAALDKVRAELGREYDLVIGGKRIKTAREIKSHQSGEALRRWSASSRRPEKSTWSRQWRPRRGVRNVEPHQLWKSAPNSCSTWRRPSATASSSSCAWMMFEVGKNWAEADADTAETIDFAEYYAREALRLAKAETPVQLPGERDPADATFRWAWAS